MAIKKISEFTSGILSDGDKIIVENADRTPKSVEYVYKEIPVQEGSKLPIDSDISELAKGNFSFRLSLSTENSYDRYTNDLPATDRRITTSDGETYIRFYFDADLESMSGAYLDVNPDSIELHESGLEDGATVGIFIIEGFRSPEYDISSKCVSPVISQFGNTVSISCSESGATIVYYMQYSGVSTGFIEYTEPFTIPASGTVFAFSKKDGKLTSDTVSKSCTYGYPAQGSKLPTPVVTQTKSGDNVIYTITNWDDYASYMENPSAGLVAYINYYSDGSVEMNNPPTETVPIADVEDYAEFYIHDYEGYYQDSEKTRLNLSDLDGYDPVLPTLPIPQVEIDEIDVSSGELIISVNNRRSYDGQTSFELILRRVNGETIVSDTIPANEISISNFKALIVYDSIKNYSWSTTQSTSVEVLMKASLSGYDSSEYGVSDAYTVPAQGQGQFPQFTVHYDPDATYQGTPFPKWYVVCSNIPSGAEFTLYYQGVGGSLELNLEDENGNPCSYSRITTPSTFEYVVGTASGYTERTVDSFTTD